MTSGLMWYDGNNKKAPGDKLAEARAHYEAKFGRAPNCCQVAPGSEFAANDVLVVGNRWIRPGFLWLGIDETIERKEPDVPKAPAPKARATRERRSAQPAATRQHRANRPRVPASRELVPSLGGVGRRRGV